MASPRNPLNIGAAARAMSNFGFENLRVVNPYEVAYAEARSAVKAGAVIRASEEFASFRDAVADCSLVVGTASPGHRTLRHTLRRTEVGGPLIRAALQSGPVALAFGSEKFGMSNDEMSHCHWLMHIPTRVEHESMNLGQAVAVCLYEIVRAEVETLEAKKPRRHAKLEDLDRIEELLLGVLTESGYVQELTRQSAEHKIRRMLRRLELTSADVPIWLGALRQIRWRIQRGGAADD